MRAIYTASRSAGLLPYALGALCIVALLAAAAGGWMGMRWQKGSQAIKENAALVRAVKDAKETVEQQRQATVDSVVAMRAATEQMDVIAAQREVQRAEIQAFFDGHSSALQRLLERRPDLRQQLGDDVLCHINRAKAGADAATTAAIPGCQPGAAVPAAAVPDRQQPGRADSRQRPHRPDVRRLPQQQYQPDPGGSRVEADRMALVLRRGETLWSESAGMQ